MQTSLEGSRNQWISKHHSALATRPHSFVASLACSERYVQSRTGSSAASMAEALTVGSFGVPSPSSRGPMLCPGSSCLLFSAPGSSDFSICANALGGFRSPFSLNEECWRGFTILSMRKPAATKTKGTPKGRRVERSASVLPDSMTHETTHLRRARHPTRL